MRHLPILDSFARLLIAGMGGDSTIASLNNLHSLLLAQFFGSTPRTF